MSSTVDLSSAEGRVPHQTATMSPTRRIALGVSYLGCQYLGWQSQPNGRTVQDHLERALGQFATHPVKVMCAGRTDTGVHGINQVVHLDTPLSREPFSWVRGTNRYLPHDIAVQWSMEVPQAFHARNSAKGRRYAYIVLESPVKPALEHGRVGWSFRPLDGPAMQAAADLLLGEHDFSSFRSSECQSPTPVKTIRKLQVTRHGQYWRFEFEASAFLHHMVRNIMGCLIAVGAGSRPAAWVSEVLAARSRDAAAPTFAADGLYFLTPEYDEGWGLPQELAGMGWLPGGLQPFGHRQF